MAAGLTQVECVRVMEKEESVSQRTAYRIVRPLFSGNPVVQRTITTEVVASQRESLPVVGEIDENRKLAVERHMDLWAKASAVHDSATRGDIKIQAINSMRRISLEVARMQGADRPPMVEVTETTEVTQEDAIEQAVASVTAHQRRAIEAQAEVLEDDAGSPGAEAMGRRLLKIAQGAE